MWTYKQSTGQLFDAAGQLQGTGYSGSPAGKNDPTQQCVKDVGPIPRGHYSIDSPRNTPTHGPFVMPLEPDPANDMCGRSAFLIHGDSNAHLGAASEGCIVMGPGIRHLIWNSNDHALQVVA
ncbi:MAG TPA: tlde1 domain-containing protein [Terracidiphilus sp.]|nr:tlde1 domain-containing protein [Terracidiphilus sp.]